MKETVFRYVAQVFYWIEKFHRVTSVVTTAWNRIELGFPKRDMLN